MKITQLFEEDDAVSPVIGVILMVAITVILAAVIGAFVLDIGNQQEQTPQTTISFENQENNATPEAIVIKHTGGDELNMDEVYLTADGSKSDGIDTGEWSASTLNTGESSDEELDDDSGSLGAGDEVELNLVHEPSGGTITSQTLELQDTS